MLTGKFAVLGERDFRIFYCGYVTSLLGTAMSRIAVTFAVLGSGGSASDLGYVFAASTLPQVGIMLGGGVLADRLGRRPVMLCTDSARLAVQGTLAAALFFSRPALWEFMLLPGLLSAGDGLFRPALGGLRADIIPPRRRQDGNALLAMADSGTRVIGPALAGILVAVARPATVIALDAASYGVSVLALAALAIPPVPPAAQSPWRDLAEGWRQFRAQTWLGIITVQFALFNLFTWAPFLLLGPVLANAYLGGARAWGLVMAGYAVGSVLAGLALISRRPRRPLAVATIGSFGYALPCLMLAVHAGVVAVTAAAVAAGVGSALGGTFQNTVELQRIPASVLARTTAFTLTGAYALGATGWIVTGPVAAAVGAQRLLGFAAAYSALSSAVVLAAPAIRSVRWLDAASERRVVGACEDGRRGPGPGHAGT